jgi:hypothetical protein
MNTVHIVVEGNTDKILLERLLADLQHIDIRFHVAGGKKAAHSLARTLQVQFKEPVALVIDADTYDLEAVNEDQSMYEAYLELTSYGIPFIVILMVPSIEAILFERPKVLETWLGRDLKPEDLVRGEYVPKVVLESYLEGTSLEFSDLVFRIGEEQLQMLRSTQPIAKLGKFVREAAGQTVA